jgi:hypothetical protein
MLQSDVKGPVLAIDLDREGLATTENGERSALGHGPLETEELIRNIPDLNRVRSPPDKENVGVRLGRPSKGRFPAFAVHRYDAELVGRRSRRGLAIPLERRDRLA